MAIIIYSITSEWQLLIINIVLDISKMTIIFLFISCSIIYEYIFIRKSRGIKSRETHIKTPVSRSQYT